MYCDVLRTIRLSAHVYSLVCGIKLASGVWNGCEWIVTPETWTTKNRCAIAVAAKAALPPAVHFDLCMFKTCVPHCSDGAHF